MHDFNLFTLRVLTEKDSAYGYFVAHCLETGNVVTADDYDTVVEMIVEVLHDEVAYALKNSDFSNLYSSPAPAHVWLRWTEAAKQNALIQRRVEIRSNATRQHAEVFLGSAAA